MTFYEILSTLMENKNVTKKQLSEKLPIGKNQFKYWETNGNIPNGETLIALSDFFDCSVDYLLGRSKQKKPLANIGRDDEKKDRLISNYEKLNAEGQEKLVEYSDDLVATNRYVKSNAGADKVGA